MYIEESDTLITSEVMQTVYVAVKHMGTSFNSIEHMIDVQEIHGVDLGSQCTSRNQLRILCGWHVNRKVI